jgi:hypothetical protein
MWSELHFEKIPSESGLYKRRVGDLVLIVHVYVDDLEIIGDSEHVIEEFKKQMKSQLSMTNLGGLSYYLGINEKQSGDGITLCQ